MPKFCGQCGSQVNEGANFCRNCGAKQLSVVRQPQYQPLRYQTPIARTGIICPQCGMSNVNVQTVQENLGGRTVSQTKSVYKEKRHGCLWWVFIGSWWWIIDLLLWMFMFIPRALMHIGRRKTYKGTSKTVSTTSNRIVYRTICTCQSCGYSWTKT